MGCGTPLRNQCPNCGTDLPAGANFYREFGTPFPFIEPAYVDQGEQSRPEPEAPVASMESVDADASEQASLKLGPYNSLTSLNSIP